MATLKTTADLKISNLTTIQISLTGANQFSDTQASDSLAGPINLVYERGMYKYPQQPSGGRIVIPANTGKLVRLVHLAADLGAAGTLDLHVAGYDGTGNRPDNTSGEPYTSADAALYREGDITVDTFAATQYISRTYNTTAVALSVILHPGQHLYFISTGAVAGLLRATFSLGWDLS